MHLQCICKGAISSLPSRLHWSYQLYPHPPGLAGVLEHPAPQQQCGVSVSAEKLGKRNLSRNTVFSWPWQKLQYYSMTLGYLVRIQGHRRNGQALSLQNSSNRRSAMPRCMWSRTGQQKAPKDWCIFCLMASWHSWNPFSGTQGRHRIVLLWPTAIAQCSGHLHVPQ